MTNKDTVQVELAQARAAVPGEHSWGVHMVQAEPRDTVFLWAESPQALKNLLRLLPALVAEPEAPAADDGDFMDGLLQGWQPEPEHITALQAGFNERFGERYELLWLGPFSELRTSRDPAPQWVRELFWFEWTRDHSTEIEPSESPPVPDELAQDFALWIGQWSGDVS